MTALLSGVVVVLVVCHTPKTVINIYECYQVRYTLMNSGKYRKTPNVVDFLEVFVGFAQDEYM